MSQVSLSRRQFRTEMPVEVLQSPSMFLERVLKYSTSRGGGTTWKKDALVTVSRVNIVFVTCHSTSTLNLSSQNDISGFPLHPAALNVSFTTGQSCRTHKMAEQLRKI